MATLFQPATAASRTRPRARDTISLALITRYEGSPPHSPLTRAQPCAEPDNNCYCGSNGCRECETSGIVAPGECCGWRNMTFAAWSSPDLTSGSWRLEGLNILPIMSDLTSPFSSAQQAFFEPCAAYNRKTGFWVLWFLHPYTKGTAVSRNVGGPYEIVQWNADPDFAWSADFYLWLTIDDKLLMKHNGNGGEYVATISDDFLTITNTSAIFGHELGYTEGGGIFVHGTDTYVMAGFGCCFCPLGSNGYLWRAEPGNVLGNYTLLGDFIPRHPNGSSVTQAQQFSVTPVYTSAGVVPMFIGIRFGSAPDRVKSHDYQYWYPLTFDASTGRMDNVTWVDSFQLDLSSPPTPPPLPPPGPPGYKCSLGASGQCFEVPASAPGASASRAACEQSCVLCDLSGTWFGSVPNVPILIAQEATSNVTATVTIAAPEGGWKGNATGTVHLGYLTVTGGFCGSTCTGSISPLEDGGPPCGKIVWDEGTWCHAGLDPACKYGTERIL